jgi:hypothetical protein
VRRAAGEARRGLAPWWACAAIGAGACVLLFRALMAAHPQWSVVSSKQSLQVVAAPGPFALAAFAALVALACSCAADLDRTRPRPRVATTTALGVGLIVFVSLVFHVEALGLPIAVFWSGAARGRPGTQGNTTGCLVVALGVVLATAASVVGLGLIASRVPFLGDASAAMFGAGWTTALLMADAVTARPAPPDLLPSDAMRARLLRSKPNGDTPCPTPPSRSPDSGSST